MSRWASNPLASSDRLVSGSDSAPFISTPISGGDSIGGLGSSSVSSNVGPMAEGGSSLGPGVA